MNRRDFLQHSTRASLALGAWPTFAQSGSKDDPADDARLIFIVLRGGLDGLFAVPAIGDPNFASSRGQLANYDSAPLPLDGLFALHPSLTHLHGLYQQKQLLVAHAMGLPYQQRSHFDAQNVLDTGSTRPFELKDGWLNRALTSQDAARGSTAATQPQAVAMASAIPLVLQGSASVSNWSGARLGEVQGDTLDRLARLYGDDPALATALSRARSAMEMGDESPSNMTAVNMRGLEAKRPRGSAGAASLGAAASQAATFLAAPKGPRLAVLEAGGWDSHINQALPQGQLMRNLAALDQAIASLQTGLGAAWQKTVVVVATEFGRTVHTNGTNGTDHGVGMAALVAGGAVRGGRVLSDWPGLASGQLLDGRDLRPTADLRSVFKGVLAEHWRMTPAVLDGQVFAGSGAVKAWSGLVHTA
ncbi:MAG: hypothetical protein RIS44_3243 [Pseudomonadota bacterium]|jgi:uncharacterized protein (DUF1501 family)